MRFYYKLPNGSAWWNLKTPDKPEGAVEITEQEWNQHIAELEAQANEQ